MREFSTDRMFAAVRRVRGRLLMSTAALDAAGVLHAVSGGNAAAFWTLRADDGFERNTPRVDLLIRPRDLEATIDVLASTGYHVHETPLVLTEHAGASPRGGIHLHLAGRAPHSRTDFVLPQPTERMLGGDFHVLTLPALVRSELADWRRVSRVLLRDLIDVGLLDETWPARLPPVLGGRLQSLLDDPEG